jgi:hypothetical protein
MTLRISSVMRDGLRAVGGSSSGGAVLSVGVFTFCQLKTNNDKLKGLVASKATFLSAASVGLIYVTAGSWHRTPLDPSLDWRQEWPWSP